MESIARDNQFDISLYDPQLSRGNHDENGLISSGCYVFVYDAGTKTLATLYANGLRTALANPITRSQFTTDGKIKFFGAAASYDLMVNDDKGNTGIYPGVTPRVHSLNLDRSNAHKCLVFPMVFNAGGTEVDTGLDLPYKSIVTDCRVEVTTSDSTETVDIGTLTGETNADPNGFIAAMSVAATGFIDPNTYTTGSNEVFLAGSTYGALLAQAVAGSDAAGDVGTYNKKVHAVDGANAVSISYTPTSSDTFAGYGYVYFTVLR